MGCGYGTFVIRKGDTLPQVLLHLHEQGWDPARPNEGVPDFAGATAKLQVKNSRGVKVIDRAGTLYAVAQIDPLSQQPYNFLFAWQPGETDLPAGGYRAEVEVAFPGGGVATFPSEPGKNLRLRIRSVID